MNTSMEILVVVFKVIVTNVSVHLPSSLGFTLNMEVAYVVLR